MTDVPEGLEKLVAGVTVYSKKKPPRMKGDYDNFRVFLGDERDATSIVLYRLNGEKNVFRAMVVFSDGTYVVADNDVGECDINALHDFLNTYKSRLV